MRDYRNAKAMAQTLREALSEKSISVPHSECLELVARTLGFRDWNVLAAKIEAEQTPRSTEVKQAGQSEPAPTLHCSFCGKSQHDVRKLIAGPAVFICDVCVGLCDDVLIGNDPALATITRESLVPKTTEELILLKARVGRGLSVARRSRESIAGHLQNGPVVEKDHRPPQADFLLGKSPEDRHAYISKIESRIDAMEHALTITSELLVQRE